MNSSVNSRFEMHVISTDGALTDLVSLKPINTNYSSDADATINKRGVQLGRLVQASSVHVMPEVRAVD